MLITNIEVSLEGLELGLSGAVPDRSEWDEPAQDRAILEFVSLLSGMVFKYGGRIIHGSHPTFTPVIVHQAELHASERAGRKPLTLFISELWEKELDVVEREWFERSAELVVIPQVGPGGYENPDTRNRSLTSLRLSLVQSMNLMVVVGGKQHASDQLTPGVAEELLLAQSRELPCFLVGGLGGMAEKLVRQGTEGNGLSLNNRLDPQINTELMNSKDVAACVGLIFEHLASNLSLFQSSPAQTTSNPYLPDEDRPEEKGPSISA